MWQPLLVLALTTLNVGQPTEIEISSVIRQNHHYIIYTNPKKKEVCEKLCNAVLQQLLYEHQNTPFQLNCPAAAIQQEPIYINGVPLSVMKINGFRIASQRQDEDRLKNRITGYSDNTNLRFIKNDTQLLDLELHSMIQKTDNQVDYREFHGVKQGFSVMQEDLCKILMRPGGEGRKVSPARRCYLYRELSAAHRIVDRRVVMGLSTTTLASPLMQGKKQTLQPLLVDMVVHLFKLLQELATPDLPLVQRLQVENILRKVDLSVGPLLNCFIKHVFKASKTVPFLDEFASNLTLQLRLSPLNRKMCVQDFLWYLTHTDSPLTAYQFGPSIKLICSTKAMMNPGVMLLVTVIPFIGWM